MTTTAKTTYCLKWQDEYEQPWLRDASSIGRSWAPQYRITTDQAYEAVMAGEVVEYRDRWCETVRCGNETKQKIVSRTSLLTADDFCLRENLHDHFDYYFMNPRP